MKKLLLTSLLLTSLSFMPNYAEAQRLESSGTYAIEVNGNLNEAENKAFLEAQSQATEKCGRYIRSYKFSSNGKLTEEEITSIAPHLMKVVDKTFSYNYSNDKVYVTCNLVIDTDDDIDKYIKHEAENHNLKNENAYLKKELNKYKNPVVNNHVTNSVATQLYNEGKMMFNNGKVKEAISLLKQAVVADRFNRDAIDLYLEALLENGDRKLVRKEINENFLRYLPDFANLYYYYGRSCIAECSQEIFSANFYYTKYTEEDLEYRRSGNVSIDSLQKAIQMHCTKPDIYAYLSLAYNNARQYGLALSNAQFSINNYGNAESYYAMGKAYESQRNYETAVKYYEIAMQKNYKFKLAYKYATVMYRNMGDNQSALSTAQGYYSLLFKTNSEYFMNQRYWATIQCSQLNKKVYRRGDDDV